MKVQFTKIAWAEFSEWMNNDKQVALKIVELIRAIQTDPFRGIGKPEPLKHKFRGFWSRRINHEHRLVYRVSGTKGKDQICSIIQCKHHY